MTMEMALEQAEYLVEQARREQEFRNWAVNYRYQPTEKDIQRDLAREERKAQDRRQWFEVILPMIKSRGAAEKARRGMIDSAIVA